MSMESWSPKPRRRKPPDVFYTPIEGSSFEDETGALPLENLLLRMVQKLDLVSGELDLDVGDVFRKVVK